MLVKPGYLISAVILLVLLASCATVDLSDDLNFDYSKAEVSDFSGYWEGRLNCKNEEGNHPLPWIKITDGKGKFGFGQGKGIGWRSGSLNADLDTNNGRISWRGALKPWGEAKKIAMSFEGQWQDKKFKLKGKFESKACDGVLSKN